MIHRCFFVYNFGTTLPLFFFGMSKFSVIKPKLDVFLHADNSKDKTAKITAIDDTNFLDNTIAIPL